MFIKLGFTTCKGNIEADEPVLSAFMFILNLFGIFSSVHDFVILSSKTNFRPIWSFVNVGFKNRTSGDNELEDTPKCVTEPKSVPLQKQDNSALAVAQVQARAQL